MAGCSLSPARCHVPGAGDRGRGPAHLRGRSAASGGPVAGAYVYAVVGEKVAVQACNIRNCLHSFHLFGMLSSRKIVLHFKESESSVNNRQREAGGCSYPVPGWNERPVDVDPPAKDVPRLARDERYFSRIL